LVFEPVLEPPEEEPEESHDEEDEVFEPLVLPLDRPAPVIVCMPRIIKSIVAPVMRIGQRTIVSTTASVRFELFEFELPELFE